MVEGKGWQGAQEELHTFFSRTCQYAIRGLLELSRQPQGRPCTIYQICRRQRVPPATLSKVFQQLARAGLLGSTPGRQGGYWLRQPGARISLQDVKSAVDGESNHGCRWFPADCSPAAPCPYHAKWRPLDEEIERYLRTTTLMDLAGAP